MHRQQLATQLALHPVTHTAQVEQIPLQRCQGASCLEQRPVMERQAAPHRPKATTATETTEMRWLLAIVDLCGSPSILITVIYIYICAMVSFGDGIIMVWFHESMLCYLHLFAMVEFIVCISSISANLAEQVQIKHQWIIV